MQRQVREEIAELTNIMQSINKKNKLINNPKIKQKSFRASGSSESYRCLYHSRIFAWLLKSTVKLYVFVSGFYKSKAVIYKNKLVMNGLDWNWARIQGNETYEQEFTVYYEYV